MERLLPYAAVERQAGCDERRLGAHADLADVARGARRPVRGDAELVALALDRRRDRLAELRQTRRDAGGAVDAFVLAARELVDAHADVGLVGAAARSRRAAAVEDDVDGRRPRLEPFHHPL